MAANPFIAFCPKKKALADLFVDAAREFVALHHAEAEALTQGISIDRFELAIQRARDKKDKIKLAHQLHVRKHGC